MTSLHGGALHQDSFEVHALLMVNLLALLRALPAGLLEVHALLMVNLLALFSHPAASSAPATLWMTPGCG